MLKIGKMTDYAILILSEMAKAPDALMSASSVADAVNLSVATVSKILKMLSEATLVQSQRGAEGGYRLVRGAADISLIDIITAMEGMALTECCESKGKCNIDSMCGLRFNWQRINKRMRAILENISLFDMQQPLTDDFFVIPASPRVIPAKAGIHLAAEMDPRLRGDDTRKHGDDTRRNTNDK